MIKNYLPVFKVMEVNNLTGLRCGHMLAQFPAADGIAVKAVGDYKFIENGIIVGLGKDGKVENYDPAKHGQMFVHYTEELNTFLDELKYFAVEKVEGEDAYPRCIALYVGDSFTTNNYVNVQNAKYAKVVNGVLNLQATADDDTAFIAVKSSLPDGSEAYEFTYYRAPAPAPAPVVGE